MTVDSPLISVIVPTRDRPRALSRCLEALSAQTVLDQLEVIVVDDGSLAGGEIADLVAQHERARLIRQSASGPAAARNAGARNARGSFLCFTDDDCEPCPDWAETLLCAVQSGADAAAGRTLSGGPESALAEASELIARAPTSTGRSADGLSFAPSNNLACRADVFGAVPFDERYPAAAGEDREWCARLIAAGYVLRGASAAALVHHQEPTLAGFLWKQVRYGRGAFRFHRGGSERRPLERPGFYVILMRRGFRHGFRTGVLVSVAQAATAVGFFLEWAVGRRR